MDEGPITHPGVPGEVYHTLGPKTFFIFFIQRAQGAIILFILAIALFFVSGQPFLLTQQFGNLKPLVIWIAWLCLVLFALTFIISYLISWLVYSHYKFSLGADSLKIKRGVLNKEEVAIPYRQIQDVDIKRDLAFQIFGLSRLVMLTAGHEDERDAQSSGILPALDSSLAEWLQAQLLQRANVQKVTQEVAPPA
jgi:uncharacterized membrane protein YdbT with pleckstrin-like domain